jgi:steroid delta-isomerase-like uncharacterized protein
MRTEGQHHMTTDDNKALLRRWHDEMNTHNAEICDQLLADDYSERNNMSPEPLEKAGAKALLQALFAAIPDMHREIVEQVAEGDRVVEWLRYSGTQQGEMFGIPATGRSATFDAVMISTVRDGKITRIDALLDSMSFMRQLGVIPG